MQSLIRKKQKTFQWEIAFLAVKYIFENYSDDNIQTSGEDSVTEYT